MPRCCATTAIVVAGTAARSAANARKGDGRRPSLDTDSEPEVEVEAVEEAAPKVPKPLPIRAVTFVLDTLNGTGFQFLFYIAYVLTFQSLSESLRNPQEFFFDKMIADTFIDNHFDSSHNTFETIRRTADIWEWGNNVLWPGLLGNSGPCVSDVGAAGGFESSQPGTHDLQSLMARKGCNDDAWPDGAGSFFMGNPTGWTVEEEMLRMDQLDWTEGIFLRQV